MRDKNNWDNQQNIDEENTIENLILSMESILKNVKGHKI